MENKEKELLLKDLCTRLPYGVMMKVSHLSHPIALDEFVLFLIKTCKEEGTPYLRPMSSMTEEEKKTFTKLKQMSVTVIIPNHATVFRPDYIVDLDDEGDGLNNLYDWLNAHHFDYRGLIERGLALEAPEDMYKND